MAIPIPQKPRARRNTLNRADGLTKNIVLATVLPESNGTDVWDMALGEYASSFTGGTWGRDAQGNAVWITPDDGVVECTWTANAARTQAVNSAISIFVGVNITAYSTTGNKNGCLFRHRNNVDAGSWDFYLNQNEAGEDIRFWGGAIAVNWSGVHPGLGYHTFGITRIPGGTFELWVDGVSQGTQVDTSNFSVTARECGIGRLGNNDNNALPAEWHFAYYWMDRAIGHPDMAALHANPYRMIAGQVGRTAPVLLGVGEQIAVVDDVYSAGVAEAILPTASYTASVDGVYSAGVAQSILPTAKYTASVGGVYSAGVAEAVVVTQGATVSVGDAYSVGVAEAILPTAKYTAAISGVYSAGVVAAILPTASYTASVVGVYSAGVVQLIVVGDQITTPANVYSVGVAQAILPVWRILPYAIADLTVNWHLAVLDGGDVPPYVIIITDDPLESHIEEV